MQYDRKRQEPTPLRQTAQQPEQVGEPDYVDVSTQLQQQLTVEQQKIDSL